MFSYFAYGLGIHSTMPLPELVAAEVECDVLVRLEENDFLPLETAGEQSYLKMTPEETIFYFKGVGTFLVRGGREIIVIPFSGVDTQFLRLYIVGTVMASLLYQRGLLVLHASAVELEDEAVAFLGESGWGKSSMSAAMHARGHGILADDVTAVHFGTSPATVFPGFPQLKLNPEAAASLGYDIASLFVLHPLEAKRGFRITHGFPTAPLPFRCIFVLAEDTVCRIDPLQPQETLIELVRHSYPTRFLHPGGAQHFLKCAHLAKGVPMYRLKRPRSLQSLPDLARLVEKHLARNLS